MFLGWSKTRLSPIGVDFGTDSIKALQVMLADPPRLVAAAMAEVPDSARGDAASRELFYAEALRTMLAAHPFKGRRAILSLPATATLVQHIQVPVNEAAGLREQIDAHLRERMNVDPARMVIRWFDLGTFTREGMAKTEVLCLAAGRDAVMRHIEAARAGGLDVVGMHAEAPVILKAFTHFYRRADDAQRTTCFIDIGAATTKVVIGHGQTMVFAKTIHAAGDQFTRQRAALAGMTFAQARRARIGDVGSAAPLAASAAVPAGAGVAGQVAMGAAARRGPNGPPENRMWLPGITDRGATAAAAPGPDRGAAPIEPPSTSQVGERMCVHPALGLAPASEVESGETLDCLIDELRMCIRYHQTMYPGRAIEKLVFLGHEALHVGTCQAVARQLRIGAQLGDPLARLSRQGTASQPGVDLRQTQPGWAVPLGLCFCEANL
jgi:type IV pilus assembly protein PilM